MARDVRNTSACRLIARDGGKIQATRTGIVARKRVG
jgi:hypothetical protein